MTRHNPCHQCFTGITSWRVSEHGQGVRVRAMRTPVVSASAVVVVWLVFYELGEAVSDGTAFSFASFLGDDGAILEVDDAAFNSSELAYDINNRAFRTGLDLPENRCGRILYKSPVRMVNPSARSAASFNTSFTFAFLKTNFTTLRSCGSGLVFTFAAGQNFTLTEKNRRGKGMCTFNLNDTDPSNSVFAVKFDSSRSVDFLDPSDSSIGVLVSNKGRSNATQYNLCQGLANETDCELFCGDKGNYSAWVDYDAGGDVLEVRFRNGSLADGFKPKEPVIRVSHLSLPEVLNETMYVGFTASTFNAELHRIRSWNFNSSGLPGLQDSKSLETGAIVGISAAVLVGAGVILGLLGFFLLKRNLRSFSKLEEAPGGSDTPRAFSYRELKQITKNFSVSERLASGGFGDVFKGTLPSGSLVAVKRIRGNREQGEESFLAEATSLRQIRHRNLLELRGWCYSKEALLVVYNYKCNGSLNKWLYPNPRTNNFRGLPWKVRRSILSGVASGLAYLHEECVQCILHRDIKSSNVLLDADFNPYLGDFGLARLVDHRKVERTTLLAGTLGYMAPEMQHTGRATKESDVYAFGVLVLEVVCERRPLATQAVEPGDYVLLDRVWRAHEAGNIVRVADTKLSSESDMNQTPSQFEFNSTGRSGATFEMNRTQSVAVEFSMEEQASFLRVGLLCCHPNPSERPSMRMVNQWFQASEMGAAMELPALPATRPHVHYSMLQSSEASSSSKSSNVSGTFQTWRFSDDGSTAL